MLLRGGSHYQPVAASNFGNWYFASSDEQTRPGGAVRLDRHAKYFLMGDSYERAATVGFRCAYDWEQPLATPAVPPLPPPPTPPTAPSSPFVGSFFFYVVYIGCVGAALARILQWMHTRAEEHLEAVALSGAIVSGTPRVGGNGTIPHSTPHVTEEVSSMFDMPQATPHSGSPAIQSNDGWFETTLGSAGN